MCDISGSWRNADLVALDLEGTGPQDPEGEAILEIALVPMVLGHPDADAAFSTLLNPGRRIQYRPWISPGITNEQLGKAPSVEQVGPELITRLKGKTIVGHNVGVDWRLLHHHIPETVPAGLIDTLRLARYLNPDRKKGHSLTAWVERLGLTEAVTQAATGSRPHRALWDTIAAALLLNALMEHAGHHLHDLTTLLAIAGLPLHTQPPETPPTEQPSLW